MNQLNLIALSLVLIASSYDIIAAAPSTGTDEGNKFKFTKTIQN